MIVCVLNKNPHSNINAALLDQQIVLCRFSNIVIGLMHASDFLKYFKVKMLEISSGTRTVVLVLMVVLAELIHLFIYK